jgi:hypothetical protein
MTGLEQILWQLKRGWSVVVSCWWCRSVRQQLLKVGQEGRRRRILGGEKLAR